MNQEEIQEFANDNELDLRIINDWHFRLLDIYGEFVLDIYIKRTKGGAIKQNKVRLWKDDTWLTVSNREHLEELLSLIK